MSTPDAPMRTLDLRRRRAWLWAMSNRAGDVLDDVVVRHVREKRPECWSDDMSWLPDEDLPLHFDDWLCTYYSHIKMFHGCRPISLRPYYELGLIGQSADTIEKTFRECFSDVEKHRLDEALSQMSRRGVSERGHVYFVSDGEHLIKDAGHYLIQGSEYLMGLAATLCGRNPAEDYRWRLRNFGIPTVIEVDVPIEMVPYPQIQHLSQWLLAEWGQIKARRPLGRLDGYSFVIHQDIPAEHIVRHWHPARIPDPHQRGVYINPHVWCDQCAVQPPTNAEL